MVPVLTSFMEVSLLCSVYLQNSFDSQNCVHNLNTENYFKNNDLGKYLLLLKEMAFEYISDLRNLGISM